MPGAAEGLNRAAGWLALHELVLAELRGVAW